MKVYFECPYGCGIRNIKGTDINKAYREILRETGTYNAPTLVCKATPEQIGWVKAMGGRVD